MAAEARRSTVPTGGTPPGSRRKLTRPGDCGSRFRAFRRLIPQRRSAWGPMTNTSLRPATPENEAGVKRRRARWPWLAAATLAVLAVGSGAYALQARPKHPAGPSDGGFVFDVGTVKCGVPTVGPAELPQKADGQFCLVDVTVRNTGAEPVLLDPGAQQAIDAQGKQYPMSDRAAVFVNDGDPTLLEQIAPGASVPGVLPFDLPSGVSPVAVELREAVGSAGVRVPLS